MSYDYDWCGHTPGEPGARPCGAPIERWSGEWKHRKYEMDADHKATPQAPVGPLEEGPEDIEALLCLLTGSVYYRRRAVGMRDGWRDAGPFIAWRDGYGYDRVLRDAQRLNTESDCGGVA